MTEAELKFKRFSAEQDDARCSSSTGFADTRRMKLCPIHRTPLFLSDGWESVEIYEDAVFC
jgi:hypothetical protein